MAASPSPAPGGWRGRAVRLGLVAAGLAAVGVLVAANDPAAVAAALGRLSWRLPLVISLPFALVTALDTLGWRYAFRTDRVPFAALLSARLAGEAVNLTTPTASMGGEPVKAWLLRRWVSLEESVPAVVIAKTTITVGQALLLLVGIAAALALDPGSALVRGMLVLLVVEVVLVGLFVATQLGGAVSGAGRLAARLGLLRGRDGRAAVAGVDAALAAFYLREPRRLALSILWHFAGWLAGILETWAILAALGLDVSLLTATVIEAFATAVRFATFMIPASLGALEGGQLATFLALGLGAPAGLAFVLVRRLREAAWVTAGLVTLAVLRPLPDPPPR